MFDGRMAAAAKAAEQIVADATPSAQPHGPELPDMSGSYGRYISSGLYDRRYPRPNRRTLRKMKRCLVAGGRFLDVGAGTGRYTLPLLQVNGTRCVAHDISPVARETLAERLRDFVSDERLIIRGDDPDDLAAELPQAFDLALLAFGVLAHVAKRAQRAPAAAAGHPHHVEGGRHPDPQRAERETPVPRRAARCGASGARRHARAGRRPLPAQSSRRRRFAYSTTSIRSTRCIATFWRLVSGWRASGPRACCPSGRSSVPGRLAGSTRWPAGSRRRNSVTISWPSPSQGLQATYNMFFIALPRKNLLAIIIRRCHL